MGEGKRRKHGSRSGSRARRKEKHRRSRDNSKKKKKREADRARSASNGRPKHSHGKKHRSSSRRRAEKDRGEKDRPPKGEQRKAASGRAERPPPGPPGPQGPQGLALASSSSSSSSPPVARRPRRGFDQRTPLPEEIVAAAVLQPMAPQHQALVMPREPNPEVEVFLALNPVEPHAANQLRALPAHMQAGVLQRGSLLSARDKTAVLTSRIRDVLSGQNAVGMGIPAPMLVNPSTSHPGIENLIRQYSLDARCAQVLRLLPRDKQDMALELPIQSARNPSAFMMAQIHAIFGWRTGAMPGPEMPAMQALPAPPRELQVLARPQP